MLTEEQNKRIAKKLELCWHKFGYVRDGGTIPCLNCMEVISMKSFVHKTYNKPFDTPEGFHLIIEHGPKQIWWRSFLKAARVGPEPYGAWSIREYYLGPRLAIALDEFLKEGGGK